MPACDGASAFVVDWDKSPKGCTTLEDSSSSLALSNCSVSFRYCSGEVSRKCSAMPANKSVGVDSAS